MRTEKKALLLTFVTILLVFFAWYILRPTVNIGKALVTKKPAFTLKNDNGRTNILILGTGGATHEGPDLTDTMIVLSATGSGQITLISLPRDIYLDSLSGKINTAYSLGLEKQTAGEIVGMPIHYKIRVDFSAFEKVIDILGGVDINVPDKLDDSQYPLDGKENDLCSFTSDEIQNREATMSAEESFPCRYEHLVIEKGPQHMNGNTALKYVRSRHAEGDEGTDFARSRRQQLVIKAVRDKALSAQNFLNPLKIAAIYNELKGDIDTDLDLGYFDQLMALGLNYRNSQVKNVYLDLNLLENPPIDQRGWILLPKSGNWNQVHEYIKSQL